MLPLSTTHRHTQVQHDAIAVVAPVENTDVHRKTQLNLIVNPTVFQFQFDPEWISILVDRFLKDNWPLANSSRMEVMNRSVLVNSFNCRGDFLRTLRCEVQGELALLVRRDSS